MWLGYGAWSNIMTYDPKFSNWQVQEWYGSGISAPTHDTPITGTHRDFFLYQMEILRL